MNENSIIAEIHHSREKLAQACDYDARKLMEYYRRRESERPDPGRKLVSYTESPLDTRPELAENPTTLP